jgi:hypothetical protein
MLLVRWMKVEDWHECIIAAFGFWEGRYCIGNEVIVLEGY